MRFRQKPVVVEAMRFTGEVDPVIDWARALGKPADEYVMSPYMGHALLIQTPEGPLFASPGDWITRGVKGEFCVCKPDIFELTYEAVDVHS